MLCATAACYAHCLVSASRRLRRKLLQSAFGVLATLRARNYRDLPLPALAKNKQTMAQLHLGGFYMSVKALERHDQDGMLLV